MSVNPKAEETRLRYLYRRLLLQRRITLPYEAAVRLIGPDCAYHLYSVAGSSPSVEGEPDEAA